MTDEGGAQRTYAGLLSAAGAAGSGKIPTVYLKRGIVDHDRCAPPRQQRSPVHRSENNIAVFPSLFSMDVHWHIFIPLRSRVRHV